MVVSSKPLVYGDVSVNSLVDRAVNSLPKGNGRKVVLGFSGGVDSSVAALVLQRAGFVVVGVFMNCGVGGVKRWPSSIDWDSEELLVRQVSELLGFELLVKDTGLGYEDKVIKRMFSDYASGLTPNPDVLCNSVGKFPLLLRVAEEVGASFVATGHYARLSRGEFGVSLLSGVDESKDQSYFLCSLGSDVLGKSLFPLGVLKKSDVRLIASAFGFPNAEKQSSRGICYLGSIDVKDFLRSRIPEKQGSVLGADGQVIGSHPGVPFFTVGERLTDGRGVVLNVLGRKLFSSSKLFVASKNVDDNVLVAVPEGHELLFKKKVLVNDFRLVNSDEVVLGKRFLLRIRHLGSFHECLVEESDTGLVFVLDKLLDGIAPGQLAVLYDGPRLVGSGVIVDSE
jgi:tRNA-specific 2-thiouridylase